MSSSASLVAALANIRAQAQELSGLIQANQKAKLRNWEQEREQKQQLISSLTQSQDILRKEKARVRAELKAQLAKQAPPPKPAANSSSWEAAGDVVDLQTKLIDLNNRLLDIDLGLKAVVAELQTCRQQDTEVLSTKLVVMQDTKRILQGEIDGLRANIFQIESIARREEDRKTAEQTGFSTLSQLEEQLLRIAARLDKAKQQLYFPEVKGYRFSTGGSGVYIAARDLFLSEVSGRFELSCERFTRPDGSLAARLTVLLAGVSASSEWAEVRAAARAGRSSGGQSQAGSAAPPRPLQPSGSSGSLRPQPSPSPPHQLEQDLGQQQQQQQRRHSISSSSTTTTTLASSSVPLPTEHRSQAGVAAYPPAGGLPPPSPPLPSRGSSQELLPEGGHVRRTASSHSSLPSTSRPLPLPLPSAPLPPAHLPSPLPPSPAAFSTPTPPPPTLTNPMSGGEPGGVGDASGVGGGGEASAADPAGGPLLGGHDSSSHPSPLSSLPTACLPAPSPGPPPAPPSAPPPPPPGPPSPSLPGSREQQAGGPPLGGQAAQAAAPGAGGRGWQGPGSPSGSGGSSRVLPGPKEGAAQKGEMVSSFLSGLSKRKDKLRSLINSSGSSSSSSAPPSSFSPSSGHPPTDLQPSPQPGPLSPQQPLGSGLGSRGSGGGAQAEGGRARGVGGEGGSSGLSLGQRMHRLRDGLGQRMERMKDSVEDSVRAEAVQERVGRMREGVRDMSLEGVKEAVGGRVDRMKGGLQEGVQESWGKLSKMVKVMGSKGQGQGAASPQPGQTASGQDLALSPLQQGALPGDAPGQEASRRGDGEQQGEVRPQGPPADLPPAAQPCVALPASLLLDPPSSSRPTPPTSPPTSPTHPRPPAPSLRTTSSSSSSLHGSGLAGPPGAVRDPARGISPDSSSSGGQNKAGQGGEGAVGSGSEAGVGAGAGAGAAGGGPGVSPGPQGAAQGLLSVAFQDFEGRPSRKGVYVQVLGEKVEVVGERGTKVPDISMGELLLEVEVALNVVVEWSALEGWQIPESRPLDFTILQLDHQMQGNNIPLPRTALKGLLNMFLPSVLSKVVLGLLPPELGKYVVESGEAQRVHGEFRIMGQPLTTYMADIAPFTKPPDGSKRALWQQQQAAGAQARGLMGLSEQQAQALAELFSGKAALADPPRPASICELCRMFVSLQGDPLWDAVCALWNRGLQLSFQHWSVPAEERFSFGRFMEVRVSRLVRKPVRVSFSLDCLHLALDVDAGLMALRDLFERLAREFHKRAQQGDEGVGVPREPLEVQLEALGLWHAALLLHLRAFKARFRASSCSLVVAADSRVFQVGAENMMYDGPLRLRVPLELALDPDNAFIVDIKLPKKEEAASSLTNMLQGILQNLSSAVASQDNQAGGTEGGREPHGTAPPGASDLAQRLHTMMSSAAEAVLGSGSDALVQGQQAAEQAGEEGGAEEEGEELRVPQLSDPVVGQVALRRLSLSLKLDEERLSELLADAGGDASGGSRGLLGLLMGCYGDLFSTSLDVGWRPDTREWAEEGATRPACMLTVANNEVTRVSASLESLIFQSCVSPRVAVRVLSAVVTGLLLRFYPRDSYQVRFWQRLFRHLHEYLGRDSLDALASLSASAELVKPPPPPSAPATPHPRGHHHHPATGTAHGAAAPSATHHRSASGSGRGGAPPAAAAAAAGQSKLRVVLAGDVGLGAAGLAPGTHPPPRCAPVYCVNDINLLTLLDSVRLLTDASAA